MNNSLSMAEILGRKLFLGSMFLGLVPAIAIIGAWNCEANGLTPQIRMSLTLGILTITGLLWLFFYACLEDQEKEIFPVGIFEFLKYLILSILGAIAFFLGFMLIFYIILAIFVITSKIFHGIFGGR